MHHIELMAITLNRVIAVCSDWAIKSDRMNMQSVHDLDLDCAREPADRENGVSIVPITVGEIMEHSFSIDPEPVVRPKPDQARSAMQGYSSNYDLPVVQGALIFARIATVLATQMHALGALRRWRVDYHQPLFVGQRAVLRLEVMSMSSGLAFSNFTVNVGARLVASGEAASVIGVDCHVLPGPLFSM